MKCSYSSDNYAYNVNRESTTSIAGRRYADPGYSTRFRFAMAQSSRLKHFRVEILGRGPEGQLAQWHIMCVVRIE
jgi:hypothetical protein